MKSSAAAAGSDFVFLVIRNVSFSKWPAVQDLCDVNVFEIQAGTACDPLLMHQARHVWRHHVFGSMPKMVVSFVQSHARGHCLVRHAERSPESAAIVRTIDGYEHQAPHFRKQCCSFVERSAHDLGGLRDSKTADRAAAIVYRDRVLKFCPGKRVH